MSDPSPTEPTETTRGNPDEEYAETYLAGYTEGARTALKEILGQASRGHTVGELRFLLQSRLAHLSEEVELRRRRLLAAPRASPWGSLLSRPGPPRPWGGGAAEPRIAPGSQVLVREERPRRALELARAAAARFGFMVVLSPEPPDFPGVPPEKLRAFVIGPAGPGTLLESLAGQVDPLLRGREGALVYLDAIETITLQYGPETSGKFVNWILARAREGGSAVVASIHPRVLPPKDQSLLERAFQVVL